MKSRYVQSEMRVAFRSAVALIALLSLISCTGGGGGANSGSNGNAGGDQIAGLRPTLEPEEPSPFTTQQTIVNLNDVGDGQGETTIPTDMPLIAVVDELCLNERLTNSETRFFFDAYVSLSEDFDENATIQRSAQTFTLNRELSVDFLNQKVNEDNCIDGVSQQTILNLSRFNDPNFENQNYLEANGFNKAFDFFSTNGNTQRVSVAVIDTGYDFNTRDRATLSPNLNGSNIAEKNDRPQDTDGHGTAIASIISAPSNNRIGIGGMASDRSILIPLRISGGTENNVDIPNDELYNAIIRAVNAGADVINISLNGITNGCDPVVGDAFFQALRRNTTIIVAAGNGVSVDNNKNLVPGKILFPKEDDAIDFRSTAFPACWGRYFKGVIAVGSTNTGEDTRARFSNYGEGVELLAPGTGITTLGLNNQVVRESGTSYSAPQVTAAIALMISIYRSRERNFTPWLLEDILLTGSRSVSELEDDSFRGRVLDYERLADLLDSLADAERDTASRIESEDQRDGDGFKPDENLETIDRIIVSADSENLEPGSTVQLSASAVFLDGRIEDISQNPKLFWSIDNDELVEISRRNSLRLNEAGVRALEQSESDEETPRPRFSLIAHFQRTSATLTLGSKPRPNQEATPIRLQLTGPDKVTWGDPTISFSAQVSLSNGESRNSSSQVEWSVSPRGEVRPSSLPGTFSLLNAVGGKTYTVRATLGGLSVAKSFEVEAQSLADYLIENRLGQRIFRGQSITLRALLRLNSGKQQGALSTWSIDSTENLRRSNLSEFQIDTNQLSLGTHQVTATTIFRGSGENERLETTSSFEVVDNFNRLEVATKTPIINNRERARFSARAFFPNNSFEVVSTRANWSTNRPELARISSDGILIPQENASGEVTVTGTFQGRTASTTISIIRVSALTGTNEELVRVQVVPNANIITWGQQNRFRAIAHFGDGSTQDVTFDASWASDINSEFRSQGRGIFTIPLTTVAGSTYLVTALYEGLRGQLEVEVPRLPLLNFSISGLRFLERGQVGSAALRIQYRVPPAGFAINTLPGEFEITTADGRIIRRNTSRIGLDSNQLGIGTHRVKYRGVYLGNGPPQEIPAFFLVTVFETPLLSLEIERFDEEEILHGTGKEFRVNGLFQSGRRQQVRPSDLIYTLSDGTGVVPNYAGVTRTNTVYVWGAENIGKNLTLTIKHRLFDISVSKNFRTFGIDRVNLEGRDLSLPTEQIPTSKIDDGFCTPELREASGFAGGVGTEEDPFLICSVNQLRNMRQLRLDACAPTPEDICQLDYFKIKTHLDFSSIDNTSPIELSRLSFGAHLDGDGYEIQNITIISTRQYDVGVFSGKFNEIKNLGLRSPTISGRFTVGGFIGNMVTPRTGGGLENCYIVGGQIRGNTDVGGLVGSLSGDFRFNRPSNPPAYIRNCSVHGTVVSLEGNRGGGLVGTASRVQVENSYVTGNVINIGVQGGGGILGGLIGNSRGDCNQRDAALDSTSEAHYIKSSFMSGNVTVSANRGGQAFAGGIVGRNFGTALLNVEMQGNITSTGSHTGGIIGDNITCSAYALGSALVKAKVSGEIRSAADNIGGLIGRSRAALIQDSSVKSVIVGRRKVGGILGAITPFHRVFNTRSESQVSSPDNSHGGLIGRVEPSFFSFINSGAPDTFEALSFEESRWNPSLTPGVNSIGDFQGNPQVDLPGIEKR